MLVKFDVMLSVKKFGNFLRNNTTQEAGFVCWEERRELDWSAGFGADRHRRLS